MLPEISNEALKKVAHIFNIWDTTLWKRGAAVAPLVDELDQQGLWLLSLFLYIVSFNKVWKPIDEGAYYVTPPSPIQHATVEDLVEVLRCAGSKKTRGAAEQELIRLLTRCTDPVKYMLLAVLSKSKWVRELLSSKEVRPKLDITEINPEDIYGKTKLLTDGWHSVDYPLIVTTVPDIPLLPAIIYKSGVKYSIYKFTEVGKRVMHTKRKRINKAWLLEDRKFINTDTFILFGLMSEDTKEFFPLDYFNNLGEYRSHRKKPVAGFQERQNNLNTFLDTQYLKQIKKLPREMCAGTTRIEVAVGRALQDSPHPVVLLCDNKDKTYSIKSETREGVIEGIWQESGRVLGVNVWSNARRVGCSFDFSGENNALLYNSKLLRKKRVVYIHFQFEDSFAGAVKEVLWDKPLYHKYRVRFLDGPEGYLERCPICLRDDTKHIHNTGVCYNTYANWRTMMASRGTNVWFNVTPKIRKRRQEVGWEPYMINNTWIAYRGHRVVANDQGQIMFKSDQEAMHYYDKNIAGRIETDTLMRNHHTVEELTEWYRRNYKVQKYLEVEDGGVAEEVPGLDEHEAVVAAGCAEAS